MQVRVKQYYVAFSFQIDCRIGDENKTMQITDRGQPVSLDYMPVPSRAPYLMNKLWNSTMISPWVRC